MYGMCVVHKYLYDQSLLLRISSICFIGWNFSCVRCSKYKIWYLQFHKNRAILYSVLHSALLGPRGTVMRIFDLVI